jgi:ketosteroid isomerase-like protein
MSEDSTTPDLVELVRRGLEAFASGNFDAALSLFAPDGVWDMSPLGVGTFEGHVAIRSLWQEWFGAYEEYETELEQCRDLGNGVVLAVVRQDARPAGSTGRVRQRPVFVFEWVDGMAARTTVYYDVDAGLAAAGRLAESRR